MHVSRGWQGVQCLIVDEKILLFFSALFFGTGIASADVLAEWTFNDTSSLAVALSSSGAAEGVSVSGLSLNDAFDFAGLNAAPATENDGFGFGVSGSADVIHLHRANYFNSTAPVGKWTSWNSGTGGDMTSSGNASIVFTVTADAGNAVVVESLRQPYLAEVELTPSPRRDCRRARQDAG